MVREGGVTVGTNLLPVFSYFGHVGHLADLYHSFTVNFTRFPYPFMHKTLFSKLFFVKFSYVFLIFFLSFSNRIS